MRCLALIWLLTLTACDPGLTASEPVFSVNSGAGSLKLPLAGIDAAGKTYRLRQGTFELNGSALMTLAVDSTLAGRKSFSTPLPPGEYQAFLRDGFQLVEVLSDGSELPVPAVLSSANPARFEVDPRSDRELRLTFRHGERTIKLGGNGAVPIAGRTAEHAVLASASKEAAPQASGEPRSP
jgi:hypothetical protein